METMADENACEELCADTMLYTAAKLDVSA